MARSEPSEADERSPDDLRPTRFYLLGLAQIGAFTLLDLDLAPMIGRRREAVWAYATGQRPVPKPVALLREYMSASSPRHTPD